MLVSPVCATEVENNLIAMGFEVTPDGTVAHLADQPLTVQPSRVKPHSASTQRSVKPSNTTTVRSVTNKWVGGPAANSKAGGRVYVDSKALPAVAADKPQQSLYEIIRQRSQVKLSTHEEQSTASSLADDDPAAVLNSELEDGRCPEREPSVKFCLEKNAFISASSAEESQCR